MESSNSHTDFKTVGENGEHLTQIENQAYDSLDKPSNMPVLTKHKAFISLVFIAQIFGVASVILAIILGSFFNDGFDWSTPKSIFNYHTVCMTLGFVFCYGDAMLVYRVFPMFSKRSMKAIHVVLMLLSFLFAIVGMKAIFQSRELRGVSHMGNIHSWVGMIIFILFALQWVIGLITFLVPSVSKSIRAKVLPLHTAMGILMFFGSLAACISGIKATKYYTKNNTRSSTASQINNVFGLCLVIFCGLVFYLVHRSDYKHVEPINTEQANSVSLKYSIISTNL